MFSAHGRSSSSPDMDSIEFGQQDNDTACAQEEDIHVE